MTLCKQLMIAGALSLSALSSVAAPVLSFNNSNGNVAQNYHVGDTVSLDFWVSGLTGTNGAGGLDLGAFDMDFSFNGNVTGFQNATFSSDLSDSLFDILDANSTSSNALNLFGLSFSLDLSNQADSFKLFTLKFTANQAGISSIKLDKFLLGDFDGAPINAESFLADITVSDSVSVPEPSSIALFLSALGLMALRRRTRA